MTIHLVIEEVTLKLAIIGPDKAPISILLAVLVGSLEDGPVVPDLSPLPMVLVAYPITFERRAIFMLVASFAM